VKACKARIRARVLNIAQVWRVEWNVTGTMLATTADDGTVK
jgi:hypothetical protein